MAVLVLAARLAKEGLSHTPRPTFKATYMGPYDFPLSKVISFFAASRSADTNALFDLKYIKQSHLSAPVTTARSKLRSAARKKP